MPPVRFTKVHNPADDFSEWNIGWKFNVVVGAAIVAPIAALTQIAIGLMAIRALLGM